MKDYSYRETHISIPESTPKDFVIANHEDVKVLQKKVEELQNAVNSIYDIIEELAKKI